MEIKEILKEISEAPRLQGGASKKINYLCIPPFSKGGRGGDL